MMEKKGKQVCRERIHMAKESQESQTHFTAAQSYTN
jgi:hypothetical protein